MSLTDAEVSELAAGLYQARRTGIAIAPLTVQHPDMTMADGYLVQQGVVAATADGDRIVGYKLGLTSKPMQQMLGVDSPDFAPVMASHVNPDGAAISALPSYIAPRLEAEIALVLREDLRGPDCTPLDVAAAVSGAVAALELVDSRVADWKITLADTVADMASSGAIVLGPAVDPRRWPRPAAARAWSSPATAR